MSEDTEAPVDQDLLLAFSTEPGEKPSENTDSLSTRVDHLENELNRSARRVTSLESALATLVAAMEDIKTIRSPVVSTKRYRLASAVSGVMFGIALGVFGWTMASRDSIDALGVPSVPASIEETGGDVVLPQPSTGVVDSQPAPVYQAPARAVRANLIAEAPIDYLGTLSIDAAPGGEVFIDRQPAGHTPLRAQDLKAGSHLVWIERDGYRRFTRVVQVPADRVSRVWADLEPLAAR